MKQQSQKQVSSKILEIIVILMNKEHITIYNTSLFSILWELESHNIGKIAKTSRIQPRLYCNILCNPMENNRVKWHSQTKGTPKGSKVTC